MLINRSVLDLVHLVELSLEEDELLARVRFGVDHSLLVLLEGVDNLEEVALAHKELEVLGVSALCIIHTVCVISMKIMASVKPLTFDGFDREHETILVEVLLQGVALVLLQPRVIQRLGVAR